MQELEACAGTQFDPMVVAAFRRALPPDVQESEHTLNELAKPKQSDDEGPRPPQMPPILNALADGESIGW
jgi:hypothetical protein